MSSDAGEREHPFELQPDRLPAATRVRRSGHAGHALRVASACNRALLRATDETAVLQEVCRIILAEGGYALVAVAGVPDHDEGRLRPLAWAAPGPVGACPWADLPGTGGPMATALHTGRPITAARDTADELTGPWFGRMAEYGACHVAAFPLRVGDVLTAVLGICRVGPARFDAAEFGFLQGLVGDIGVGIGVLRERALKVKGDAQLARVHRALRTLSAGNRCLLRARSESQLLAEMCAAIVDEGCYPVAWVGYAQHDAARSVRVMAHAGRDAEALERMQFTWADSGIGVGPTGTAIRSGQPVIARDLRADARLAGALAELAAHGFPDYGATSVFPLRIDDGVIGNLSIFAPEPESFDEAEARLLGEMADDLAYGIGVLRAREHQREAEATIERMAFHDPVTGLPNRTLLHERLEAALEGVRTRRRPLALLALKVEQFQEISDSLGYREGERLLGELALRLGRLTGGEELLTRGGEDEFVVLMPDRGAAHAIDTAQRLRAVSSEPVELSGLTVSARLSIGIALAPGHGTDADALIRRASVAAYQARNTVAGYALYTGGLDADCTRRLALMGDLRQAIDHNQLQLYCQPKVGMGDGCVCGAEALVRWPHPQLGLVSTGEFVKLAEHAGLIGSLTHWVLDAAFGQAYAWREAGFEQPLAVNLSARDLHDPMLVDHVRGLFVTWGAAPDWIQFELTESALMEDPAGTLETLRRLRTLGVELFVDDFGTGYSSLSYLQKLPVDAIKIDQSFVARMTEDEDSATIVRSTIELGHNLSLGIVAEGVESRAVWQQLAGLGCDTAQGYFVSRPLPAEQFKDWELASPWHRSGGPPAPM